MHYIWFPLTCYIQLLWRDLTGFSRLYTLPKAIHNDKCYYWKHNSTSISKNMQTEHQHQDGVAPWYLPETLGRGSVSPLTDENRPVVELLSTPPRRGRRWLTDTCSMNEVPYLRKYHHSNICGKKDYKVHQLHLWMWILDEVADSSVYFYHVFSQCGVNTFSKGNRSEITAYSHSQLRH